MLIKKSDQNDLICSSDNVFKDTLLFIVEIIVIVLILKPVFIIQIKQYMWTAILNKWNKIIKMIK